MPKIMTKEYCERCPFFDAPLGYLEPDHPYWKQQPTECACKECLDREHCEQYGPKTLRECIKSEIIRRHGVAVSQRSEAEC